MEKPIGKDCKAISVMLKPWAPMSIISGRKSYQLLLGGFSRFLFGIRRGFWFFGVKIFQFWFVVGFAFRDFLIVLDTFCKRIYRLFSVGQIAIFIGRLGKMLLACDEHAVRELINDFAHVILLK